MPRASLCKAVGFWPALGHYLSPLELLPRVFRNQCNLWLLCYILCWMETRIPPNGDSPCQQPPGSGVPCIQARAFLVHNDFCLQSTVAVSGFHTHIALIWLLLRHQYHNQIITNIILRFTNTKCHIRTEDQKHLPWLQGFPQRDSHAAKTNLGNWWTTAVLNTVQPGCWMSLKSVWNTGPKQLLEFS